MIPSRGLRASQALGRTARTPNPPRKGRSDDDVKVSMIEGRGPFRKWGRNPDLDSANAEQVWFTGGTETLPTSDLIDSLVSTDAGDDQTVIIDVMTISGTTLTRVVQEAVVDGTNAYSGFAGHIGKGGIIAYSHKAVAENLEDSCSKSSCTTP